MRSIPRIGVNRGVPLEVIKGSVPDPYSTVPGCPFHPRCPSAMKGLCDTVVPQETAVDGFTMRRPIGVPDDALVVLGIGGRRLAPEHGAPARLLVPGLYGQYAGVKWLRRLTALDREGSFYWASRGWPAEPRDPHPEALQVGNRVDLVAEPATHLRAGVARRKLNEVEVVRVKLLQRREAAAFVEPGVLLLRGQPERQGRPERHHRTFADVVVRRRVTNRHGPF